jgi:hypothetical protein
MIAIGGSIGSGLFIGSGGALAVGGPAFLIIGRNFLTFFYLCYLCYPMDTDCCILYILWEECYFHEGHRNQLVITIMVIYVHIYISIYICKYK